MIQAIFSNGYDADPRNLPGQLTSLAKQFNADRKAALLQIYKIEIVDV